jgi:hypothetical protein
MALTGADGRFVLDSVAPGARAVGASHAALDSLGVSALAAAVDVAPGAAAAAAWRSPPPRARVLALLCGAAPVAPAAKRRAARPSPAAGVLVGAVGDARPGAPAGARLAGAEVSAQFVAGTRDGRALPEVRTATTRTDSAGAYVLCNLPPDAELVVRAGTGTAESGPAYVTLGERGVARLDLAFEPVARPAAAGAPAAGDPAAGRPVAGTATLVGVVRDTAGAPRPLARVRVADRPDVEVRADSSGRFALAGLARGTQTVIVSAIGYTPQPATVDVRGAGDTAVVVLRRVTQLAGVTARARFNPQAAFRDELARRRRVAMGYFVDSVTVDRMGTIRGGLVTAPYVQIRTPPGSPLPWVITMWSGPSSIMRPSMTCRPDIWLDGRPTDELELDVIPPANVIGIEVYRRANQAPMRYLTFRKDQCGAVMVWTQSAR